jgi:hypothetical protein
MAEIAIIAARHAAAAAITAPIDHASYAGAAALGRPD